MERHAHAVGEVAVLTGGNQQIIRCKKAMIFYASFEKINEFWMTQVRPPREGGRIDDIEALRAVAILFVVFSHLPGLFFWGTTKIDFIHPYFAFWDGVDLFFAISGFVIARDLVPKIDAAANRSNESRWRTVIAFWIKRAWRILPSAWLWIALTLAGAIFFNRSHAFGHVLTVFTGSIAALLQVANFRMWDCFYTPYGCATNSIYWSLSLEEQFYIVLPIACLFLRQRVVWLLAFAVISQIFIPREPAQFAWVIRSDALALGALLAIASRKNTYKLFEPKFLASGWMFIIPVALIVALAALPAEGPKRPFVPFSTGLIALVSAALVFIASFNRNYITRISVIRKPLAVIGTRSYALYLVHFPAYAAAHEIWFRLEPPGTIFGGSYILRLFLTALVIIVVATELTHRCIEIPMRRRGRAIAHSFEANASVKPDGSGSLKQSSLTYSEET